ARRLRPDVYQAARPGERRTGGSVWVAVLHVQLLGDVRFAGSRSAGRKGAERTRVGRSAEGVARRDGVPQGTGGRAAPGRGQVGGGRCGAASGGVLHAERRAMIPHRKLTSTTFWADRYFLLAVAALFVLVPPGGFLTWCAWVEWSLAEEADQTPQRITLGDLT